MRDPRDILSKYYDKNSNLYSYLIEHSQAVADKSLKIAKRINEETDIEFIEEAALLHDIGIFKTDAPKLGCYGDSPYICHGIFGREILSKEGLERHGKVCERHIGVGISTQDIQEQDLPLPERNMEPKSLEEKIITYADLFYSKNGKTLTEEKSINEIEEKLYQLAPEKVEKFQKWQSKFEK